MGFEIGPEVGLIKCVRDIPVAQEGTGGIVPLLVGQALDEYFFVFALVELYVDHLQNTVNCVRE